MVPNIKLGPNGHFFLGLNKIYVPKLHSGQVMRQTNFLTPLIVLGPLWELLFVILVWKLCLGSIKVEPGLSGNGMNTKLLECEFGLILILWNLPSYYNVGWKKRASWRENEAKGW